LVRVLVAQANTLLRGALTALLCQEDSFRVVAEAAGGTEVLPAAVRSEPDVALLHLDLPGEETLSIATRLRQAVPAAGVLVLTGAREFSALRRGLGPDAPPIGFATIDSSPERLRSAVRRTAMGEHVIDAELVVHALAGRDNPLSPRDREVLALVAQGEPVSEIAARLFLSPGTVRNYLARINVKLGARTRIEAIGIAREADWI
jgi:two-component system, NarL family, response regulator DesR